MEVYFLHRCGCVCIATRCTYSSSSNSILIHLIKTGCFCLILFPLKNVELWMDCLEKLSYRVRDQSLEQRATLSIVLLLSITSVFVSFLVTKSKLFVICLISISALRASPCWRLLLVRYYSATVHCFQHDTWLLIIRGMMTNTEDNSDCQDGTIRSTGPIVLVQMHSKAKMTALKEHYRNNFPARVVMALSVSQIVAGALSCILQVSCLLCLHK